MKLVFNKVEKVVYIIIPVMSVLTLLTAAAGLTIIISSSKPYEERIFGLGMVILLYLVHSSLESGIRYRRLKGIRR